MKDALEDILYLKGNAGIISLYLHAIYLVPENIPQRTQMQILSFENMGSLHSLYILQHWLSGI